MVHTAHHKTPRPRPKHSYTTVASWTVNEGLVFVGALLAASDTHRTAFSSCPPIRGHLDLGGRDADRKNMTKK